eukprot:1195500-Prorocentrum_minimum.AAC.18
MLTWQQKRAGVAQYGTEKEKAAFAELFSARMASLRERKNTLSGMDPTDAGFPGNPSCPSGRPDHPPVRAG